jgi:RNA polymerase-binding transcription factor DksA
MAHLTDDQLQNLRKALSDRGRDLNDKIMALQAGKTLPPNATDVPFAEPGEEPEARLKRFLGIVQGKMKLIREGGNYGHCKECGEAIEYATLEREPWREVCDNH